MIYHLLYISEATAEFKGKADIESILAKSRQNNAPLEVTGILIYNKNFFIQLLEGRKEHVRNRYQVIGADKRHKNVRLLAEYQDMGRIFPEWSMGLALGSEQEVTMNDLVPYLHQDIRQFEKSKEKIVSILKRFNSY